MSIQFKSPRVGEEFNALGTKNSFLLTLLIMAENYSRLEFKKDLVITCILRTSEENAALYKESGKEPSWKPHTQWLAADLRSSHYTQHEITKLLTFLNTFTVFSGQRKAAVYHSITGNVAHFHVQAEVRNA